MISSSVWLHWNYTWTGDIPGAVVLKYQSVTYKSSYGSTIIELAKRNGASGVLEKSSSISDPIGARIDVIANNSTLVVHNLQYNDSGSNFSSFIQFQGLGGYEYPYNLFPFVIKLRVDGELFLEIIISTLPHSKELISKIMDHSLFFLLKRNAF